MLTKRMIACVDLAAILVFGVLVFRFVKEADDVDACLDQGGSFDYHSMVCDTKMSHDFIPYSTRQRGDGSVALGTLTIFAVSVAVYMKKLC